MISLSYLQKRAKLKKELRSLLETYNLLEVDTPILGKNACPDPYVEPVSLKLWKEQCFLQPSPELFLKRLIAIHPIDCYWLGSAFRLDPPGSQHNPEFLMLEAYLMGDAYERIQQLTIDVSKLFLGDLLVEYVQYKDLWQKYLDVTYPCSRSELETVLHDHHIEFDINWSTQILEDLIMGSLLQPHLGKNQLSILEGFSKEQAALAVSENDKVYRFEVFFEGMELANGYHELQSPELNRTRFLKWTQQRFEGGNAWPLDEKFLSSLKTFPPCSGVAIGIERLIMLSLKENHLGQSMLFSWSDL